MTNPSDTQNDTVYCRNCRRMESRKQADSRNFNTGRCMVCNGELVEIPRCPKCNFATSQRLARGGCPYCPNSHNAGSPQNEQELFDFIRSAADHATAHHLIRLIEAHKERWQLEAGIKTVKLIIGSTTYKGNAVNQLLIPLLKDYEAQLAALEKTKEKKI